MEVQETADTTTIDYWLNWRVYLCAVCVLLPMVLAFLVIWKRDGPGDSTSGKGKHKEEGDWTNSTDDESWKPCLKEIHPVCLLAVRVIAFSSLLATLIAKVCINGGTIFYYYTQWTFTLVTIYFGCASLLSVFGCYHYIKSKSTAINVNFPRVDADQGPNMPLLHQDAANLSRMENNADPHVEMSRSKVMVRSSRALKILFQMSAGAVMLTDCVYWFIIFPFLTLRDYDMNFMTVNMHTVNVVLLLGDTALNSLQIPWSGMSFFVLWTGAFVIFQWIIHACVSIWWPYPFLDLSSSYAPLWYLLVALMHIPCYGLFVMIVEVKHYLLSRWFPSSYQC